MVTRRNLIQATGVAALGLTGSLFARPAWALPSWPNVARGGRDPRVATVQYLLRHRGYGVDADGIFGPATETGVKQFQSSAGVSQTGVVDAATWPKLIVTVRSGNSNQAVRAIQWQLNRHGYRLVVDGDFGPATEAAVRAFQSADPDLPEDGVAGAQTWQATVGTPSGRNFRLSKTADSPIIAQLKGLLPSHSFSTMLDSANRTAGRCTPNVSNFAIGFCWNSEDNATSAWWTQGITTTADAASGGTYDGRTSVAVAWYYQPADAYLKGVRISFVDWANTSAPVYRHVLLVEPYDDNGTPNFRPVRVHAGGVAWYGHHLYLADTSNGFRVFDARDFLRVSTGNSDVIGRQSDGSYHGFNYLYVLPQKFRYMRSTTGGIDNLRYSFVGLDRTSSPQSLLVGEYLNEAPPTRIVRWPLDSASGLLRTDTDGYARATESHAPGILRMQGVAGINGRFIDTRSNGSGGRGDLVVHYPGGTPSYRTGQLPIGPEDLSYWPARDQLWSNSEYPGGRNVYAFRASAYT